MRAFKRVYIDTSILRSSHWPSVSVRFAGIIELAKNFNVKLFIPKPVDDEREEQWLRDIRKAFTSVKKAHKELSAHLYAVGERTEEPEKPELDILREKYRVAAAEARRKFGIDLSPMTSRSVAALFPFAIARNAPFQETGEHVTGFQDAVIFFSVIDDAQGSGELACAVFSEDRDFGRNVELGAAEGVNFQHVRTYRQMWDIFAEEITPALSSWWSDDRMAAREAVEADRVAIEAYLVKEIAPESIGALVKQVLSAKVANVLSAETPLPAFPNFPGPYQRIPDSVIPITGTLRVSFGVLGVRYSLSDLFGVLSERTTVHKQLPLSQQEPELQEEVLSKSVEFECKGTFCAEGYKLSDFHIVNISS